MVKALEKACCRVEIRQNLSASGTLLFASKTWRSSADPILSCISLFSLLILGVRRTVSDSVART